VPEFYQYILVRSDLPKEHQVVQASHAAIKAAKKFGHPEIHQNLVVCHVKDENELIHWSRILFGNDVDYQMFQESDMDNQVTALATEHVQGEKRKIFKKLRLLQFDK
jgi:hypothetical protein